MIIGTYATRSPLREAYERDLGKERPRGRDWSVADLAKSWSDDDDDFDWNRGGEEGNASQMVLPEIDDIDGGEDVPVLGRRAQVSEDDLDRAALIAQIRAHNQLVENDIAWIENQQQEHRFTVQAYRFVERRYPALIAVANRVFERISSYVTMT